MNTKARAAYQRKKADHLAAWFQRASVPGSIESLGVSVMTRNALIGAGIWSIDELCAKTLDEVKRIHGLGKTGRQTLLDALAQRGRKLTDDKDKAPG
ncbi:MAG TPA: DNA-directed RNA polymerase subunit alpha C-terminal domain-containing protein [Planctomycetaceae bacterium]|jgi:DNA-directed RNA polymerase alpha subunit